MSDNDDFRPLSPSAYAHLFALVAGLEDLRPIERPRKRPLELLSGLEDLAPIKNEEKNKEAFSYKELYPLYRILTKLAGECVGIAGDNVPIYGELEPGMMDKAITLCKEVFGLTEGFRVIDIGSGVGKPSWHFAGRGAEISIGIECVPHRHFHSMRAKLSILKNCKDILNKHRFNVAFECLDVTELLDLGYFDLVYMFDCGFPPHVHSHIASIIGKGRCRYLVAYDDLNYLSMRGFKLKLVGQISGLKFSCSTNTRTAYYYLVDQVSTHSGYDANKPDPLLVDVVEFSQESYEVRLAAIDESIKNALK
jgi:hypothetical protein